MKALIIVAIFAFLPFSLAHSASTDYYLKLGDIKGEVTNGVVGQTFILDGSKSQDDGIISRFLWKQVSGPTVKISNATTSTASVVPTVAGTYVFDLVVTDSTGRTYSAGSLDFIIGNEAPETTAGPALLEIDTIRGETTEDSGKVETEWKVEKGEKNTSIEPDEIDVNSNDEPLTPDFSILLGGGSDDDKSSENNNKIAEILTAGAKEAGAPVENVSLNYEEIKIKVKHSVKLLGFIPISTNATVDVNARNEVKVKFPWWAFLASGKDKDNLGQQISSTIFSVLQKNQALVDGLLIIRY